MARLMPLALLLVASPAFAQQPKSPTPAAKETAYGYVFGDDLLAGRDFDPNDVQIRVLRHPMRKTLIRLRTNFVPEMIVSVEKL